MTAPLTVAKYKYTCRECNKLSYVVDYQQIIDNKKLCFCCKSAEYELTTCLQCGTSFHRKKRVGAKKNVCSDSCQEKALKRDDLEFVRNRSFKIKGIA